MPDKSDDLRSERDRFAILVDGDNAQPDLLDAVVAEVSKYGVATVRRAYGNWRSENLKNWGEQLHAHAFIPVHHAPVVTGKNATDTVLIIDAMDLLYSGVVDGFCIVSSDSDFTRLAIRLREAGKTVLVIGREDAPRDLKNAGDVFVSTDVLRPKERRGGRGRQRPQPRQQAKAKEAGKDKPEPPLDLLERAYDSVVLEDGWAPLGTLGNYLRRMDPSFDPRGYGYSTLGKLFQALPDFEYKFFVEDNGKREAYVRLKE